MAAGGCESGATSCQTELRLCKKSDLAGIAFKILPSCYQNFMGEIDFGYREGMMKLRARFNEDKGRPKHYGMLIQSVASRTTSCRIGRVISL